MPSSNTAGYGCRPEEQLRKNIGLEISRIHRAAQDIGGFPEMGFKLGRGDAG